MAMAVVLLVMPEITISASAQAPPSMPTITGKYTNSDYGVQMTFPDGWQAIETKSPGGVSVIAEPPQANGSQGSMASTIIALSMMPKSAVIRPDPNMPEDPQVKCNTISSDKTNLNNMSALVTVTQCSGPNVDIKMKGYSLQTDMGVIYLSYITTPSNLYDSNVANFDTAVNTLQIPSTTAAPAVPEFPASAGIVMAIIIGLAILVTRTRMSWNLGNSSR